MLDAEQIEAFQEMNAQSLNAATDFAEDKGRGALITNPNMISHLNLVSAGIRALIQIIAWQTEMIYILDPEDADESNR